MRKLGLSTVKHFSPKLCSFQMIELDTNSYLIFCYTMLGQNIFVPRDWGSKLGEKVDFCVAYR